MAELHNWEELIAAACLEAFDGALAQRIEPSLRWALAGYAAHAVCVYWHADLRPGRADAFDQRNHPVHLAVGIRIDQLGAIDGPCAMNQHPVAGPGQRPKLFGQEGHDRMQQRIALIQHPAHRGLRLGAVFAVKQRF
jgi:hypothetical protein